MMARDRRLRVWLQHKGRFALFYSATFSVSPIETNFYDMLHINVPLPGLDGVKNILSSSYHQTGQTHTKMGGTRIDGSMLDNVPLLDIDEPICVGAAGGCDASQLTGWKGAPAQDGPRSHNIIVDSEIVGAVPWTVEVWAIGHCRSDFVEQVRDAARAKGPIIGEIHVSETRPQLLLLTQTMAPARWAEFQQIIANLAM